MNEQDDTKLWQILGHASQPAPGDDFARKVMMRIEREECAPAVPVESIHHFKRHSFRIWGAAAAALVAAVIGIGSPDGTFCPGNGSPFHRHLEY